MLERIKARAPALKRQVTALYLAFCDPRTPWYAKAIAAVVIAYAVSPIDLIPDVIPVLGMLDDLLLIPLGVALAVKLIPAPVWRQSRERAQQALVDPRFSRLGTALVIGLWLLVIAVVLICVWA